MSFYSDLDDEIDPETLLKEYKHPYLYYQKEKNRFRFSISKTNTRFLKYKKKQNVFTCRMKQIRVRYCKYFNARKINSRRSFLKMLEDIHKWLKVKSIEISNCGCKAREEKMKKDLEELHESTLRLADLHESKWEWIYEDK